MLKEKRVLFTLMVMLLSFGFLVLPAPFAGCEGGVSAYIRTWPLGNGAETNKGTYWKASQIQGKYLDDLVISFALIDQKDKSTLYVKDMEDHPSEVTPGRMIPGFKNLW